MSAWSDHHPSPVRRRHLVLALAVTAAVVVLVLFWRQILALMLLAVLARVAWLRLAGGRRRPRSSWSSLLRSGAVAYAAWNSRWLKPTTHKASIQAAGQPTEEDLEGRWS